MTPTLSGRIQTRIFLLATLGVLWTLLIGPFLPADGAPLSLVYRSTLYVLGLVLVLGLLWELVYHGLQQFRWEKDWPTMFGLLNGVNEGVVVYLVARSFAPSNVVVPGDVFLVHFVTTWFVIWLWANGPMRVPFLRWRFNGGRLV